MEKERFCQFGKEIRMRLVEIDKTQNWLIQGVREETGLFFDRSYLYKIMTGKTATPKITQAIRKILKLNGGT